MKISPMVHQDIYKETKTLHNTVSPAQAVQARISTPQIRVKHSSTEHRFS